jgi:NAD(P)-dependent dehydrogenase (short-subunit alcohol dehydrogenase family)
MKARTFSGKVALVTGGTSGIGKTTAIEFARAGIVHRTRGKGRTVNLCVEDLAAATQFVPDPRTRG